jgi:hypothetical protein
MSSVVVEFEGGLKVFVRLRQPPSPTVERLLTELPFHSSAHRWGDEVYFEAPFHIDLERDARQEMEVGDVAFWPDGDAAAIFFGPTPASRNREPRAYSPCNIIGQVDGDASVLKQVREGTGLVVKIAQAASTY